MRILLDVSLPGELTAELPGHEVRTVQEMGWSSMKNGELLACAAAGQFDVFDVWCLCRRSSAVK